MKILHVLISPRAEGTPRLVLDWLSIHGHQQELLFLSAHGELRQQFNDTGVWQHYNTAFEPRVKTAFKIAALVEEITSARKPDVVISWSLGFSHWVALGARRAGVRRNIAHAGNAAGSGFMGRYVHTWISFTMGRMLGNKIVCCSEYVRQSFASIPFVHSDNLFAVYNCARISRFIPDGTVIRTNDFVMVGTFEAHKDQATLLRAWKLIQSQIGDAKLFLAGDGSLRLQMEQLASELALERVEFLGSIEDVPALLQGCQTFVFSTTVHEGFGTVLLEAMAAGCRIIATDVPACREVLADGKYGTLVPPQNPEAFAASMLEVAGQPLSKNDYDVQIGYASQFSPEEMIRKYINIVS